MPITSTDQRARDLINVGRDCTLTLDELAQRLDDVAAVRRAAIFRLYHLGYSCGDIGQLISPEAPLTRQAVRKQLDLYLTKGPMP